MKLIFALCMEDWGPKQITKLLMKEKVLNSTTYKRKWGSARQIQKVFPYYWNVVHILERQEYIGCTGNN